MSWKFCPHCGGELPPSNSGSSPAVLRDARASARPGSYDQVRHWKDLVAWADKVQGLPTTEELVDRLELANVQGNMPLSCIVHLILDRPATPSGGALLQAAVSQGRLGDVTNTEKLKELGYVIEAGKVKLVDEVPVGRAWCAIQYWGGDRQHKRWHMTKPAEVNPDRHGDPFFMDDNMVAFGVEWNNLERCHDAFVALIEQFRTGFDGISGGNVRLIDVFWFR